MPTLDHVVFPIRDAAKTLEFYRETLGLPLVAAYTGEDWGGYPWLMMSFGLSARHEIVCVALRGAPAAAMTGLPPDCRHYAMLADTPEDLDRWRGRLEAAGVAFWEETHGVRRSLYFPDPDGVVLELTWPSATPSATESAEALAIARNWAARTPIRLP